MNGHVESLTSLRNIASLIDQGSQLLLLGGREMEAIVEYSKVFHKLRDLEVDRAHSLRNDLHNTSNEYLEITVTVTSSVIPQLFDRQFYIYNHVCHFKAHDHHGRTNSPRMVMLDINLFSAVALFNSALCFHSVGKKKFDRSCFNKSLRFYGMCFEVLNQMANHTQGQLASTLMVAAINNMSHIYFELRDFGNSDHMLEYIFQLNLPPPPAVDLHDSEVVASIQWEEIFVNTLVAKCITVAPSA